MPPDIIASLASLSGPAPPGSQLGRGTNGPPGADPDRALFASLLAQSTAAQGTLPQAALIPAIPKISAALRGKLTFPPPSAAFSQKPGITQKKLGNTKTMDTVSEHSSPSKEKDAQEGELLLPHVQVDVPAASSQLTTIQLTATQISVLPLSGPANRLLGSSLPSTLLRAPVLKTADPTASLSAASGTGPELPTKAVHASVPVQNTRPGSPVPVAGAGLSLPLAVSPGLALPRTFAVAPAVNQGLPAGLPTLVVSTQRTSAQRFSALTQASAVSTAPSAVPVKTGTVSPAPVRVVSVTRVPKATVPLPSSSSSDSVLPTSILPEPLANRQTDVADAATPVEPPSVIVIAATSEKLPDEKLPETSLQNSLKSPVFPADNQTVKNTDRRNTRVTEINLESSPAAIHSAATGKSPSKDEGVPGTGSRRSTGQGAKDSLPAVSVGTSVASVAAAATDAVPLTATERAAAVKQAVDGLGMLPLPKTPGGTEQITLHLHPKDWGSLHISVTLTPGKEAGAAKAVTAHIVADTPQVKAALESQSEELHQTLRASGLHLEHLTVSVRPETVQSAAETAHAGTSTGSGQSQESDNSGFGQTPDQQSPEPKTPEQRPFDLAAGAPSGGGSFAAFSGGNQSGRQDTYSPQSFAPPFTEPERTAAPTGQRISHPGMGHIDTHA